MRMTTKIPNPPPPAQNKKSGDGLSSSPPNGHSVSFGPQARGLPCLAFQLVHALAVAPPAHPPAHKVQRKKGQKFPKTGPPHYNWMSPELSYLHAGVSGRSCEDLLCSGQLHHFDYNIACLQ